MIELDEPRLAPAAVSYSDPYMIKSYQPGIDGNSKGINFRTRSLLPDPE